MWDYNGDGVIDDKDEEDYWDDDYYQRLRRKEEREMKRFLSGSIDDDYDFEFDDLDDDLD